MPTHWHAALIRHSGLCIAVLVLLAYWPLSTFQNSLSAGDTLDCWLPWRFFISASLFEGSFPAWNPYQQMGYPVHADLQGPAWYPEALLIGGTVGHGAHTLSVLFLGYVIVGGMGMRRMVLQMECAALPAFLAGLAYALSGFFTGHAMHFYAVISAAWMPWLLWAVFRLLDGPNFRNALLVALFLFFLLTGGNHTFLIIAGYPLLALGAHSLYVSWRAGDHGKLRSIMGYAFVSIAVAVVLSIGTIHALWEVGPYLDRTQGLALSDAEVNPFTYRAALSLLVPSSATDAVSALGTDLPMANGYFGALILAFGLVGLFRRKPGREWIFLIMAAIAFLASLGPALPVHAMMWRWLPGMDLFRFPAYFYYFVLLGSLPTAAQGFARVMEEGRSQRLLQGVIGSLCIIVTVIVIQSEWSGWLPDPVSLLEAMHGAPIGTKVIVNGTLQIALFIMAILVVRCHKGPLIMASLIVIEMMIAVQFTQWSTALGPVGPADLQSRIDAHPAGPVLPEPSPMAESRDGSKVLHHLWRNTQVFRGIPTHDGFNSFWLKDHQRLQRDHPGLSEGMQRMPLVYLASDVISNAEYEARQWEMIDSALAVVADAQLTGSIPPTNAPGHLEVMAFEHDAMELDVEVQRASFLVVQQNHYPGWRIRVDGAPVHVHRVNIAAFGAVIPAGRHAVEVDYHKPELRWLLALSMGAFLLVLYALSFSAGQGRSWWVLSVSLLALAFGWSLLGHEPKAERIEKEWSTVTEAFGDHPDVPILVNSDRRKALGEGNMNVVRIDRPDRTEDLDAAIGTELPDSLWLAWAGLPMTVSMRIWSLDRYGPPVQRVVGQDAGAWMLVKPNAIGVSGELLFEDLQGSGVELMDPEAPFTAAFRIPVKELRCRSGDHVVVDLCFLANGIANGRLVMERKRGDRTVDYEAIPFGYEGTEGAWRSHYVTRPLRSLGHDDEDWIVYVWNESIVPVRVSDLRIRVMRLNERGY